MRTTIAALGTGTVTSVVSAVGWPALLLLGGLAAMTLLVAMWILAADTRAKRLAILIGRDWHDGSRQHPRSE